MARQVFLDTETTGLDPRQGHRIIEVAGVEMVNRRSTGRHFHRYLNPQREIDAGAEAVHGITAVFLQDKPLFADIVDELLEFLSDAELVIHNAPFDIGFLNHELTLLGRPLMQHHCASVLDTLKLAKDLHPGQKNNLDALCRRYEIDNANRTLHGALLDAELLAAVYLGMTRGQESLIMSLEVKSEQYSAEDPAFSASIKVIHPSPAELSLHEETLTAIRKESQDQCIWLGLKNVVREER
ncbi:MAG TPA: DNA polymerase III subunit epsilon [Burkholderiales bacterium]|nr:DNA polymerase III subunit epsilon [Burkholderiales bacterium]